MPGKAKPKAERASRASKPRKPTAKPKSPPKAGAKAKPGADVERAPGKEASRLIDERIRSLGGWRGETLAEVRRLIHEADPDVVEECKWVKPTNPLGVPVWSHAGIVCTGEGYNEVVKLTFARGASLPDPRGLFNASLEGNTRRAIDIREGEAVDAEAFKALFQAAVEENLRSSAAKSRGHGRERMAKPKATRASHASEARKPAAKATKAAGAGAKPKSTPKPGAKAEPGAREANATKARRGEKVVLLSGGNPQIAKGDGDAPVQAYIAAMPGWKRDVGKRLDALIVRSVPHVRKAVKWNSPFYGVEGQGWFLSFHVFTRYVKVTFFRGASLRPVPPGAGKDKDARWVDVHEDALDEAQMADWVKQAAALPGWTP